MSSGSEKETVPSVIVRIAAERPWLLYIYMKLLEIGSNVTAAEVAEALGIRSYIVQRAMWWLKKYGLVEEVPGTIPRRYKLKSVEDPRINEIMTNRWTCGNTTVVRLGANYIVFINREEEILTRIVPVTIVDAVREAMDKYGVKDVGELSKLIGVEPPTVAAAVRVINTMFCREQKHEAKS